MVTAIVIPIICLYFFWLTRKEMKEHDKKWLALEKVNQESVISGEVKSITEEKQRFYYHRYIFVQTLKIQTNDKLTLAKKSTPITKNWEKKESFQEGQFLILYGRWEGATFTFSESKER